MLVRKYPQSHLFLQSSDTKIIIDPGNITFNMVLPDGSTGFKVEEFQNMDAYLITHSHADHVDPLHIKEIAGECKVYGNKDVVEKLKESGVSVIETKDRQSFRVGSLEITPVDLPHCKMQDGSDGPPNTGFLIDGVLFHPGDGDQAPASVFSKNIALPIAGPSITEDGALKFAKDLQAEIIIPIHYDSRFSVDVEAFRKKAFEVGLKVIPLFPGDETEI